MQYTSDSGGAATLTDGIKKRLSAIRSERPPLAVTVVARLPDPSWQATVMRCKTDASIDPEVVANILRSAAATQARAQSDEYVIIHQRPMISDLAITLGVAAGHATLFLTGDVLAALSLEVMVAAGTQMINTLEQRRRCSMAAREIQDCLRRCSDAASLTADEPYRVTVLPQQAIAFWVTPAPR